MKTILRVAGTELRILFFSPIAWFVLIVFLIQTGIVYFGLLEGIATQQEMGGIRVRYIFDLTARVFVGRGGLFNHIMENLYLYVPLLTMGLISRETSSGTIRLLYSSPIKVREIIFGKYLAMVAYSLLLVSVVMLFVCTGMVQIKDADKGMLMTSILGFYLLLCTYSAIGLFMSCLTTYQIVAAVCTFVMIGALSYVGSVWQGIDFVRDITYYLSISGRTEKMLRGLITSKDIFYYLVIIFIFLGLSIYKLKAGMESRPASVKFARYISVIVVGLTIGYITSRPSLIAYYDATVHQRNSLLPNIQQIVGELGEEPLEVYTYNNVIGGMAQMGYDKSYNMIHSTWEKYTRFKKGHNIIVHKSINYYDSTLDNTYTMMGYPDKSLKEIAHQVTKANGVSMSGVKTPEQMRQIVDLRPEMNRYVMELKYKGKSTFLRIFDDQAVWPSETEVSAAFKRLMQAKLPKVAFLTGNMERSIFKRSDREYAKISSAIGFRYSLINQGFDVDTVSLNGREVPADVTTLVIGDPKLELTPLALDRLKKYIDAGGNLLITTEPGKQNVMNPILAQLGLELTPGMVIQEDKDAPPDRVRLDFTAHAGEISKHIRDIREDSLGDRIYTSGVSGIAYQTDGAFKVQPLLVSDTAITWNRIQPLDPEMMTSARRGSGDPIMMGSIYGGADEEEAKTKPETGSRKDTAKASVSIPPQTLGQIVFSPQHGDTKGPITTAVALSRNINGKEQRIIVSGDADFMKNSSMSLAGFYFTNSLFSWLSYDEFPISSYRPSTTDNAINVTTEQIGSFRIIYLWVLPGALIAFAAILLMRRKRK